MKNPSFHPIPALDIWIHFLIFRRYKFSSNELSLHKPTCDKYPAFMWLKAGHHLRWRFICDFKQAHKTFNMQWGKRKLSCQLTFILLEELSSQFRRTKTTWEFKNVTPTTTSSSSKGRPPKKYDVLKFLSWNYLKLLL